MKTSSVSAALFVALSLALPSSLFAAVTPASLFRDHAVLQQGRVIPVWGVASPGEKITVELKGKSAQATADASGRWMAKLPAVDAGGPYELTIRGQNTVTLRDVLVGEVWICSGQSNMERQLGLRSGQKPINGWEATAASADYPAIRHFGAKQTTSLTPQSNVEGEWLVCSPETAPQFTAVGFFFGRALYQSRHVPIGLIHSSWGGTFAEAWTSGSGLRRLPELANAMAAVDAQATDPAAATLAFQRELAEWYKTNDQGSGASTPWQSPDLSTNDWSQMKLPTAWEDAGLPDFDGVVWFRKTIDLPADWEKSEAMLDLGPIDDVDTTWVNGVQVGATELWNTPRHYRLAAGVLKPGKNVIAIRVLDTGGNGGLWGNGLPLQLKSQSFGTNVISLEGPWQYKVGLRFTPGSSRPPYNPNGGPNVPTVLYNGMISPLLPYAIRGVIWYQGEANADKAMEYRRIFPNLIADWREKWGQGDFPFLFVQIAPFKGMNPEIRQSQLFTRKTVPNTAMAVTTDVGDANDIHPTQKQPVGERLALAARALAYGEKIEYSGPEYNSVSFDGPRAVIRFSHVAGGLVAPGGQLLGFSVAGADGIFHSAKAKIEGETVIAISDEVAAPKTVRYGWADVPECNLFNRAGLPASPFRSDDQAGSSEKR